jgi:hypothetical protein
VLCEIRFQSLCQLTPRQHDATSAAFAFQPDIRAEPGNGPFVGAARVLLPEAEVIVDTQVR